MKTNDWKGKIGDKVMIPLVKSIGVSWLQSSVIFKAIPTQDHLYIVNISEDDKSVELHTRPNTDMGEFFAMSDTEPYHIGKRIQRLIKIIKQIEQEKKNHPSIKRLKKRAKNIQLNLFE